MKICVRNILLLFLLSTGARLFAQNEPTRIILDCKGTPTGPMPLFVFKVANKEWAVNSTPKTFKPEWIKNIKILKSSDGLKYGKGGENGVVVIEVNNKDSKRVYALIREDSRKIIPIDN
ncbi:hypothetical protein [Daejeonella lutea]|uniref:Uncharacterized protein n=1 Tax=Daejeonella lutea TaxID=572036 RepID=A0A1T5A9A7_9SPHI|nr:hypothetical protein [Daejeonella lutea]SKB31591.1 hypothetical protein SAMN05661099_0485 [Daejeonella lutea]